MRSTINNAKKIPTEALKYHTISQITPNRNMATLIQLKNVTKTTKIQVRIENEKTKNPFGSKAKNNLEKNHIFLRDRLLKTNQGITHSKQNKGLVSEKELPDIASSGDLIRGKKGAFNLRVNYFYRTLNTTSRYRKPTVFERPKVELRHLKNSARMMELKREKPIYFKHSQLELKKIMTTKGITASEKFVLLNNTFKKIFKQAKNYQE